MAKLLKENLLKTQKMDKLSKNTIQGHILWVFMCLDKETGMGNISTNKEIKRVSGKTINRTAGVTSNGWKLNVSKKENGLITVWKVKAGRLIH